MNQFMERFKCICLFSTYMTTMDFCFGSIYFVKRFFLFRANCISANLITDPPLPTLQTLNARDKKYFRQYLLIIGPNICIAPTLYFMEPIYATTFILK